MILILDEIRAPKPPKWTLVLLVSVLVGLSVLLAGCAPDPVEGDMRVDGHGEAYVYTQGRWLPADKVMRGEIK